MSLPLHVVLDGTPLLGQRSGIGTYVTQLVQGLAEMPDLAVGLSAFTVRNAKPPALPPGVRWRHRPAPARALRSIWQRLDAPPAEWLTGGCDVFHGTNFVLPPLARAAGVVTVHDLAYLRLPDTVDPTSRAYRELVPRGLRRAAVVLTPSQAVADEVRAEYGLTADRVHATPLGVSPAWSHATPLTDGERSRLGLPDRFLVFVGNREPRKNLGMLVRAHRAARRTDPQTVPPLVLAGPAGWGTPQDLGEEVLLGYLPADALRSVVASADALLLPSRYEGFGLPVLEAMACGTPVICSDLLVLREVAGPEALFLPADDADAWSQALIEGPPGRPPDSGLRRAQQFTWARCASLTAEAYQIALS